MSYSFVPSKYDGCCRLAASCRWRSYRRAPAMRWIAARSDLRIGDHFVMQDVEPKEALDRQAARLAG